MARWTVMALVALAIGISAPRDATAQQQERQRPRQARDVGGIVDQQQDNNSRNARSSRNSSSVVNAAPGQSQPGTPQATKPGSSRPTLTTVSGSKGTTGTASRLKAGNSTPGAPSAGGKPGAKPGGGGGDYGASQKFYEVTKSMVESLRPARVDYDAEEMREKPGVIILNPRRHQPGSQQGQGGQRNSSRSDGMVRPL